MNTSVASESPKVKGDTEIADGQIASSTPLTIEEVYQQIMAKKANSACGSQEASPSANGASAHPGVDTGTLHPQSTLDKLLSSGDDLQAVFRSKSLDNVLRTMSGGRALDDIMFNQNTLSELIFDLGNISGQKSLPSNNPGEAGTSSLGGLRVGPELFRQITPVLEKLLSASDSDYGSLLRTNTFELLSSALTAEPSLECGLADEASAPPSGVDTAVTLPLTFPTMNKQPSLSNPLPSFPSAASPVSHPLFSAPEQTPGMLHSLDTALPPPSQASSLGKKLPPSLHRSPGLLDQDAQPLMAMPPGKRARGPMQDTSLAGGTCTSPVMMSAPNLHSNIRQNMHLSPVSGLDPAASTSAGGAGNDAGNSLEHIPDKIRAAEADLQQLEADNLMLAQQLESVLVQVDQMQRQNQVLKVVLLRQCQNRGLNVCMSQLSQSVAQHAAAAQVPEEKAAHFAAAMLARNKGNVMTTLSQLMELAMTKLSNPPPS